MKLKRLRQVSRKRARPAVRSAFTGNRVQGTGRPGERPPAAPSHICELRADVGHPRWSSPQACVEGVLAGSGEEDGEHDAHIDHDQLAVVAPVSCELEVM